MKQRSSTHIFRTDRGIKSTMNLIVTILLTQLLLNASITTQETSEVFHHYGSFPGYYKKYKMSLTTTTTTAPPETDSAFRFGQFYPVDTSKYFIKSNVFLLGTFSHFFTRPRVGNSRFNQINKMFVAR